MPRLFLKQHLQFWYLFVSGFFVIWIGFVVFLSLIASGEDFTTAIVPLVVTGIIGGFQFLVAGCLIIASRQLESYRIRTLTQEAWLVCDQVDNAKVWQDAATASWARFQEKHQFPRMQLLIATLLIMGVGVYIFAMGAEWLFLPILVGLLVAFYGIIWSHHHFVQWQYQRFYQFHQSLDVPRVYLGKHGFYSEMVGYQSLHGLTFIQLLTGKDINSSSKSHIKAPAYPPQDTFPFPELDKYVGDRGWGFLQLSVRQHVRRMSYTQNFQVRIPREQVGDAETIVDNLRKTRKL